MNKREKILIIVDMQNDFLTGSLANEDAVKIVPGICELIKSKKWDKIIATRDTHSDGYLQTSEGKHLPVEHCINGTAGHCIDSQIFEALRGKNYQCIDKYNFGYSDWYCHIQENDDITMVGTCTDICVVSNALMLKAQFPEANITVLKDLCAGTTKENHEAALQTMRMCQIEVK